MDNAFLQSPIVFYISQFSYWVSNSYFKLFVTAPTCASWRYNFAHLVFLLVSVSLFWAKRVGLYATITNFIPFSINLGNIVWLAGLVLAGVRVGDWSGIGNAYYNGQFIEILSLSLTVLASYLALVGLNAIRSEKKLVQNLILGSAIACSSAFYLLFLVGCLQNHIYMGA